MLCSHRTTREVTLQEKDEYLERVLNVEEATFTPAVFLTSGGVSNECKQFINRLADLIASTEGTEERRWTTNMRPLFQKSLTTNNLIPAPMME